MTSWNRNGIGIGIGMLIACFSATSASADGHEDMGEELYHQHCGACHGAQADGKGALSSILDPAPPDLTRIAARRDGVFPDPEIIRIIDGRQAVAAHGVREMPVWGKRFAEGTPEVAGNEGMIRGQLLAIVAYLKSIQVEGAAEPSE